MRKYLVLILLVVVIFSVTGQLKAVNVDKKNILEYFNEKEKLTLGDLLTEYRTTGDISNISIPHISNKNHKWLFNQLLSIIDEMKKYNIISDDYMNTSNWGYKDNNTLGIFDLGFGDYYDDFEEAPSEIVMDDSSGLTLLDFIKDKLDIKTSTYIDSGFFGFAHDIGNGKILKITKDKTEAINANKVKGKTLKHIAEVDLVKSLKTKNKTYYIIILEKLKLDDNLDTWFEELEEIFKENISSHFDPSVIDKIKAKNKYYGEFLKDMTELGSKKTWKKWRDIIISNNLEDDYNVFNDLEELSQWIKGSKTNNNEYDSVSPLFIDEFLEELI